MAHRLSDRSRLDRAFHRLRTSKLFGSRVNTSSDGVRRPTARMEYLEPDQLLSRAAGAEPIPGNAVQLLRDGVENYPAWFAAIAAAERTIHFENYIFRGDVIGREFADALAAKARSGVAVRLLYDWMGCFGQVPFGFWRRLRNEGVEVRCFNRPRPDSPFSWLSRNHRKTVSVDGEIGFVAGLCVGDVWVGDPVKRLAAWRDTGIAVRGPAVAAIDAAFADSWAFAGGTSLGPEALKPEKPSPEKRPRDAQPLPADVGDVTLRVIGSKPNTMGLYRLDQLVAGIARRSLWLTDAYFVGTTAYVRTLCDAARDGVDVRLLVPGASDIVVAKALSRAGYRPLLEAGIRVFEWNGPMLHAKTAVADGRWARIGSSNLNLASWLGNWELDVAIENQAFAAEMEAMFEADLHHATEIVLDLGRVHATVPRRRGPPRRGSPGRLTVGAVGLGSAVSAAITDHRALGPAEAKVMAVGAAALFVLAAIAVAAPLLLTVPVAIVAAWVAVTLLIRAWRLRMAPVPVNPDAPGPDALGPDARGVP